MELLKIIHVLRHLERTNFDASNKPPYHSKLFCTHFAIENPSCVRIRDELHESRAL